MKLTVVIVSYNVCDLLRNCLRSVFASAAQSCNWLDVDVIVVDNASRDGSVAMVAAEFPTVHLVASQENLGFTGGNNLALDMLGFGGVGTKKRIDAEVKKRGGEEVGSQTALSPSHPATQSSNHPDLLLLLNPDAEIVGDALGQMAAFLRDNQTAGVCGAHLRYGDGRFQHGAFRFPTLAQVALDLLPLADLPGLRRFWPRLLDSPLNGRYPLRRWQASKPFWVDFVLGAAMMVRGEAIQQVGVLDDAYFMYCEEMDWCLRLQQAGWSIFALPAAHVIHHEGQSSLQARWTSFERLWRSRFRFYRKYAVYYSPGSQLMLRLLVRCALLLRGWQARRRFAQGAVTGEELQQELHAYQTIGRF